MTYSYKFLWTKINFKKHYLNICNNVSALKKQNKQVIRKNPCYTMSNKNIITEIIYLIIYLNLKHFNKTYKKFIKYKTSFLINKLKTIKISTSICHDITLEIRAGTGGLEASHFALEILTMYLKLAEKMQWAIKIVNYTSNVKKGIKDASVNIQGLNVFYFFKYESGIHRVQRVPSTDTQGRIHTSTCSVYVIKKKNTYIPIIKSSDLRIDVYRSSGPGGQSVNTTDSAVRIIHIPTKIIVQCQNEKSQIRNRLTALKILYEKLQKQYICNENSKIAKNRKNVIQSGDRSEKIRTYNYIQDRCTDHRSGITEYNLIKMLSGNINSFIVKNIQFIEDKR